MTKITPPPIPPSAPLMPRPAVAPSRLAEPPDPAKIAKAAKDFEAMAIGQLLQPMFDTVDTAHSAFGGGDGEAAWKPMLVQEIAKQIAANGGLGLAQPVYEAMLRMQEAKSK
ncbi:rod-binding protein [Rhodopila sp.]|uniref:rod-binding protein n=1 Tax=Rhodopila sp. TaxID=2480087 RepID=UPI003D11CD66